MVVSAVFVNMKSKNDIGGMHIGGHLNKKKETQSTLNPKYDMQ